MSYLYNNTSKMSISLVLTISLINGFLGSGYLLYRHNV